ncbi:peroxiredoxin family protein [Adhaeribacter rhizoryzae]|uniref:TlpA family protein disulfide reductase n=1 Tax=Adhaeribacter rhizoryzae TaxID=2607907 RepID=A0A5M6DQ44_9BACT|nr:TlpA disulfide reductase family protein [Adhaeribacter rhizoryzae]KAA5548362.1 TlpA family protein disulfide reductase [Adhaeribacter rhizoryzae]
MKQRIDVLGGILVLALCSAMLSCITPAPTIENHEAHHSEAATSNKYTPVMSWAHQREIYIASGMSASDADAKIVKGLTDLAALDRSAGDDRIGVAAPPFQFNAWLNSEPLSLEDLKGRVVLIRWWTDTCPFCASSAPALRALHEEYADRGLTVIGVFHPKAGRDDPLDVERVQRAVNAREFQFPVAIDWEWRTKTLKEWWLTGPERPATSVTFILDKSGVIQFVHPGMEYHDNNGSEQHAMCANDMGRVRAAIERLIAK